MKWSLIFLLMFFVLSCRTREPVEAPSDQPLVEEKYRLMSPEEKAKKIEDDELAFMETFFQDPQVEPTKVRQKFDAAIKKKRDLFRKDQEKVRKDFVDSERKARQSQLQDLENARKGFLKKKVSRERRTEFFNGQDRKRKEFFAEEREKRSEFESEMRNSKTNFEDYAKDKTNEFNQGYRSFVLKHQEMKSQSKRP